MFHERTEFMDAVAYRIFGGHFRVVFLFGMVFTQKGFEQSNATVRGTVACDGLTEQNIYFRTAKMQTNPFKSTKKKGFDPSCRAGGTAPADHAR